MLVLRFMKCDLPSSEEDALTDIYNLLKAAGKNVKELAPKSKNRCCSEYVYCGSSDNNVK